MSTRKFLSTLIPALPMLLTALLVILVTVIFIAAMRSKAHAQFGGAEQPMFQSASTEFTPQSIPGLALWWDFRDLTTNLAVLTWPDRIQTNTLVSGAGTTHPTNTSTGVKWTIRSPNPYLTMTNVIYGTNGSSLWFLWMPDPPAGASRDIFARGTTGFMGYNNTKQWFDTLTLSSAMETNILHDCALVWGNTGFSYTNGVVSLSGMAQHVPWTIQDIGGEADGNFIAMRMWVILYYTNSLTQGHVTSLHNWATNLFNFTP